MFFLLTGGGELYEDKANRPVLQGVARGNSPEENHIKNLVAQVRALSPSDFATFMEELNAPPQAAAEEEVKTAVAKFSLKEFPPNEHREKFEARIEAGDNPALGLLLSGVKGGLVGIDPKTQGRAYVQVWIDRGYKVAQEHMNAAAANLEFDFTETTGPEYLEGRVQKGDAHAKGLLDELNRNKAQGFWPPRSDQKWHGQ